MYMFKAKLIESRSYYSLHRRWLWLGFISILPIGFFVNHESYSWWVIVVAAIVFVYLFWLTIKSQRSINAITNNRILEMDDTALRITGKGGNIERQILLSEVDQIAFPTKLRMPDETIVDITKDLAGKARENYLVIRQGDKTERLDFLIESYYMLRQMDELIAQWQQRGLRIEC
jgi:hypothetical protein